MFRERATVMSGLETNLAETLGQLTLMRQNNMDEYERDAETPTSGYQSAGTASPHLDREQAFFEDDEGVDCVDNAFLASIGCSSRISDKVDMKDFMPPPLPRLRSYQGRKNEENDEIEKELFAKLEATKTRKVPTDNYVCNICFIKGHYITDCPQKDRNEMPTPYRGSKICYGEFNCWQCKRKWASANSKANESRQCSKCRIEVFPRKQLAREKAIAQGKMTANGQVIRRKNNVSEGFGTNQQPRRW